MKVGSVVGIQKLKNAFDQYAPQVLGGYIVPVEKDRRGERRKYRIIKPLPSKEEYSKIKAKHFAETVESLVDDARGEIENLAEEMRNWYDNLSENLQQGERAARIEEAADALENIDLGSLPDCYDNIEAVHYPSLKIESRADRASDAASRLRSAIDAIETYIDDNKNEDGEALTDETIDELNNYKDELETAADELENVEFPGMYS